jgi:hypothetical protein
MANRLGWWIFLLLISYSCYEEQEGCLNVLSSNFDVSADVECDDCCNFPSLNLNITYPIPALDSVLQDVNGNDFVVEKLSFYLSNIQLLDDSGEGFTLREKITYEVETDDGLVQEKEVSNNFLLANAVLPKSFRLGTFEASGPYAELTMELNIPDSLGQALEGSFDFNHPLSPSNGLLNEGIYYTGKFTLLQTTPDSTRHEYFMVLPSETSLRFPISFFPDKGANIQIHLGLDFSIWWSGLDFNTLDAAQVATRFNSQFIEAFQLLNIE